MTRGIFIINLIHNLLKYKRLIRRKWTYKSWKINNGRCFPTSYPFMMINSPEITRNLQYLKIELCLGRKFKSQSYEEFKLATPGERVLKSIFGTN